MRIGVEYPAGTFASGPGESGSGPAQAAADDARFLEEGGVQQPHEPPACSALGAVPEGVEHVAVFICTGSVTGLGVVAIDVDSADDVLTAAIRQLATVPAGALDGLWTVFEQEQHIETAVASVSGTRATIGLPSSFATGGYGNGDYMGTAVLDQLSLTVFANSTAQTISFEIGDSCETFWEVLGSATCYVAERVEGWSALTGISAYEFVEEQL